MHDHTHERGFTLIEMIVAVGLFAVVMVICVSTLFALVNANRKAQALQSVMNNLNITLDGMARAIREGSYYYCGTSAGLAQSAAATIPYPGGDCTSGDTQFFFEQYQGLSNTFTDQWSYKFDAVTHQIEKSVNGGANFVAVTSPEITIDDMKFYVIGTKRYAPATGDITQPKVVIVVKGTAAANNQKTRSTFHIQVAATQRVLDL